MERVMKKFLDENSPLELNERFDAVKKDDALKFCLWPMPIIFSTANSFNKNFVCKNETFDEQGRLILFYSDTIFCELEKLTADLVEMYQPTVTAKEDGKRSFLPVFILTFFSNLDYAKSEHGRLRADTIRMVDFRRLQRIWNTALQF